MLTQQSLGRSGIRVHPVVLDRADTHLNAPAAGVEAPSPERPFLNVCGDALALPFHDSSFDVVGSSLFVHHLLPEALARFTAEALRVARHAFVINDLVRNPLHYVVALVGCLIYRSRLTRHDAPASVRAAYTVDEVRSILSQSGATAGMTWCAIMSIAVPRHRSGTKPITVVSPASASGPSWSTSAFGPLLRSNGSSPVFSIAS